MDQKLDTNNENDLGYSLICPKNCALSARVRLAFDILAADSSASSFGEMSKGKYTEEV